MTMKTVLACMLAIALQWSCGTGLGEPGTEGGPCFGNGTCNDGLTCLSDRCVRWDEDPGGDVAVDAPGDLAHETPPDNPDPGQEALHDDDSADDGAEDTEVVSDAPDPGDSEPIDACLADCDTPIDPCPGDLCRVPAGPFWMGANKDGTQCPTNALEPKATSLVLPCHEVVVPEFWIDRFEVTVAAYAAYLAATGPSCTNPEDGESCEPGESPNWGVPGREQHPLDMVSWYQAKGFCEWTGKRLCSEAEWEKAARGTDGRLYPWGNETPDCEHAVMRGITYGGCDTGYTLPVGSKPLGRSPYGVDDLAGNVQEWVQDWGRPSYEGAPLDGSAWEWETLPSEPADQKRVFLGSDFTSRPLDVLVSHRFYTYPRSQLNGRGFRCCTSVVPR